MSDMQQQQHHLHLARQAFPGPDYKTWLNWFHHYLKPGYYCEIGVASGQSMALVRPDTRAIGIDPAYAIDKPLPAWTRLFRMNSDEFFRHGHARQVLGQAKIDFSFIDGLHTFDQTLRDFIHVEHFSGSETVVLFHDVMPIAAEVATRQRQTLFWTGDTFKVMAVLAETRPDLKLALIPCFPSGLGIVTRLKQNPATPEASANKYAQSGNRLGNLDFASAIKEMRQCVPVLPNDFAHMKTYLRES
jgi:hypothetical protein